MISFSFSSLAHSLDFFLIPPPPHPQSHNSILIHKTLGRSLHVWSLTFSVLTQQIIPHAHDHQSWNYPKMSSPMAGHNYFSQSGDWCLNYALRYKNTTWDWKLTCKCSKPNIELIFSMLFERSLPVFSRTSLHCGASPHSQCIADS